MALAGLADYGSSSEEEVTEVEEHYEGGKRGTAAALMGEVSSYCM